MTAKPFSRYLAVFFVVLVVFLLLPIPLDYAKAFIRASGERNAKTMVFGASSVDMASKCDADKRSIAQMVAEKWGQPVADASRNGITLEGEINVAATVVKFRELDTLVFAAGWRDLLESDALSLHDAITFHELNPELALDSPAAYYHGLNSLFSGYENNSQPFTYNGITYPGAVKGLFEAEAELRTCPENDGTNLKGISATYFHNMIEYAPEHRLADLIISLSKSLQDQNRSMVFLLLPINFERLGQINSEWPALLRNRRTTFINELTSGGVRVLDETEGLSNDAFIDRWCGCPHFTDRGRMFVADKLAQFLATVKVAAGKP